MSCCHERIFRCSTPTGSWHLFLFVLLLSGLQIQESSSSSSSCCYNGGTFLWLSDAHYDAFYGTQQAEMHTNGAPCKNTGGDVYGNRNAPLYSAYGCGSNLALLTSAVQESARLSSKLLTISNDDDDDATSDCNCDCDSSSNETCQVDFIIFTGDAIRHNVDSSIAPTDDAHGALVNSALTLLHNLLQEYFPGVPTVDLPALDFGNNDLLGDYELVVNSSDPCLPGADGSPPPATNAWLVNVTATHSNLFMNDMEAAVFACGGYLNRLVRPNLRIISLNSIVWSIKHTPAAANETIMNDPFGQFAWLKVQLEQARDAGDKIYLTGHVPPMLQSFTGGLGAPLMPSIYVTKYFELLTEYQNVIAAQLFGHVHSNELRAVPPGALPDHAPPIMIQGSIAPCYTTTPFFSVVSYDRDGPTKYPTNLVAYNVDLDLYNETTTTSSSSSTNTSIWKRMFTNLTASLGMAALTNAETRLLAERMAKESHATDDSCSVPEGSTPRCISTFQQYFDYWYKGIPQTDCDSTLCQVQEACLVYNGFDEAIWQKCVSNGFRTPVSTTTSASASSISSNAAMPLRLLFIMLLLTMMDFLK